MSVFLIEAEGEQRYVEAPGFYEAIEAFRRWWFEDEEDPDGEPNLTDHLPLDSVALVSLEDVVRVAGDGSQPEAPGK